MGLCRVCERILRMLRKRKRIENKRAKPEASPTEPRKDMDDGSTCVQERPRICLIDVDESIAGTLTRKGFNCYSGTLGSLVEVNNQSPGSVRQCLLNYSFPPNLHEYDIMIIDLQEPRKVPYVEKDHVRPQAKGHRQVILVSSFPETIFDPRPLSANLLGKELKPFVEKESVLIILGTVQEKIEYHSAVITERGPERRDSETHSLYDFYGDLPYHRDVCGRDTRVVLRNNSELALFLERHNEAMVYEIAFTHPTCWENNQNVKDERFIPLIEGRPDEVVSFACVRDKNIAFFFPRIREKEAFLVDLLDMVLPGIMPTVFPFATQYAWLRDQEYQLPNEEKLLKQKDEIEREYTAKVEKISQEIEANHQEYGFLHDLLRQSGPELVKTVGKYLRWLGFDNVVNVDETNPEIQEEDLRIENGRGLLVIEVKGIGGTSTDSECSQISKIRYRRSRERGKFDVFALYIVNHQRFLPPASRSNPPFKPTQVTDAENDDRGLITTYELFHLYFNVINGHVAKEDAQAALYKPGLVRFPPSHATLIVGPYEICHGGQVVIIKVGDFEIRVGDVLILADGYRYRSAEVLEIQIDGTSVTSACTGEIGVRLSERVKKHTVLYRRSLPGSQ